ncbi:Polysaccharide ABC transporter, ATP-binding protein [Methanosarcina mazei Go1]|uniref:Polysaccharide ABC transporter, ATP-binding protein n=1 Tax=Methanosarcina mazei (strain ATCC BAA-159 / DSM 3647 / Goe1 / Go1 / JCM 11833 / OCM 88) TaxID=192952 RepID=Q8PZ38_METMA|nr:ABC transporter ATP-binding protein [Methanosarcina mazei]AAM30352.1 Polysaccharide ABC transporter, ATP-binding protein [Methanosarcina mazei Go1]WIM43918.1 ABC transporter ATP-binding protein [Methanosarcina mazei]
MTASKKEEPIIEVKHLSKQYNIGVDTTYKTLSESFTSAVKQPIKTLKDFRRQNETFWALKDVNFEVERGEVLGIIGRNGAGKSTLLKILSRITSPTQGEVRMRGRVGSLLEVGTGFHPELSGRENIYFNGSILGMKKKEIDEKFDEIVKFSGVEKFLDTPVKRYSSGMQVRLAFSVAANLDPEILVVDEVLAVGDAAFQEKCLGKMSEVVESGRTVLFVSHNMGAVQNLCQRCILLNEGHLITNGKTADVINYYLNTGLQVADKSIFKRDVSKKKLFFTDINLYNTKGEIRTKFTSDENILIAINYNLNVQLTGAQITFEIFDQNGICILSSTNFDSNIKMRTLSQKPGEYIATCPINVDFLRNGLYYITISSSVPNIEILDIVEFATRFEIESPLDITTLLGQSRKGVIFKNFVWQINQY